MALIAREYSSEEFTYCSESRCFVAEASDFGRGALTQRIWSHADGRGFVMISSLTLKRVLFLYSGDKRDSEGELVYQLFLPYDLNGRRLRGEAGSIELKLFND